MGLNMDFDKPKPQKRTSIKLIVSIGLTAFAALIIFASPLFEVSAVLVEGNSVLETNDIIKTAGLERDSVNIFSLFFSNPEGKLLKIPYIKSAKVKKTLPDEVLIAITERTPKAYYKYKNQDLYLLLDGDGMVLETAEFVSEKLPVVVGVNFDGYSVGEFLKADNSDVFSNVVVLSRLLTKYELDDIIKLDVSDINSIHLYINNIDILFGSMNDADKKIQILKGISEKIDKESRGFLHIQDTNHDPWFETLK